MGRFLGSPRRWQLAAGKTLAIQLFVSLVPLLKGENPEDWRKALYYHYYEYPGWHMVQRHEGAYDGRYKLVQALAVPATSYRRRSLQPNQQPSALPGPQPL